MTEESQQMLLLLQELTLIKDADEKGLDGAAEHRKRRKQIKQEMKRLAAEKKPKA